MVVCAFLRDFSNMSTHFDPMIRVVGINQQHGCFGTLGHVTVFLASTGRVDSHILPIIIAPDRVYLRLTVWHQSR